MKISRSEYYYHKNHRTNIYKEANRSLDVDILRIYNESKKRYGSPKIQKILENEGKHVSVKRIGKRMRFLKIKSCIVKKYRPGSSSKKVDNEGKNNLLNQEFEAKELREKMVSDITYIYVKNYGWTYLATVEDLCSRAIIGYSYGKTIDADLVVEAITLPLLSNLLSVPLIILKSKLSTIFFGMISVITTSVKSTVSTGSGRIS